MVPFRRNFAVGFRKIVGELLKELRLERLTERLDLNAVEHLQGAS